MRLRWPILAVLFVIAVFSFYVCWSISGFMIDTIVSSLTPISASEAVEIMTLLQFAFGIIGAVFITMIVFIYAIESLSDEPEYFWRQ